jgi:hypothetical protein
MAEETEKRGGVLNAVRGIRDGIAKRLGFSDAGSMTGQVFGAGAARLEAQARKAAEEGHLLDAASLGIRSMREGAWDMMQKGAMKRVMGGEHVETSVGAPATPAASPAGRESPKR